jgi:hypothetical protein
MGMMYDNTNCKRTINTTFDDMSPTMCTTEVHDCFVRGDFDRETMASSPEEPRRFLVRYNTNPFASCRALWRQTLQEIEKPSKNFFQSSVSKNHS